MSEKDLPLMTAGQRLREARLGRGLSLADVAAQTRIAPEILADIESDEVPDQLAPLYVRSFVRTYAIAVGLGAEEVLSLHDRSAGQTPAAEPVWEEEVQVRKVGGIGINGWVKWLLLVVLAGVAVVIAARALDHLGGSGRTASPAGLAPAGIEQQGGSPRRGGGNSPEDRSAGGTDTLPPGDASGAAGAAADSGSPGR